MNRSRQKRLLRGSARISFSTLLAAWVLLYALPCFAGPRPVRNGWTSRSPIPGSGASLSGSLIKNAQTTTTWFLYPNACNERAANTWTPQTSIVADSLNTYNPMTQNHGYGLSDLSLQEKLWHITDGSDSPDIGAGLVLSGSRSLWCGKYDPNQVVRSGYPDDAYQILYVDTDPVALAGGTARSTGASYTLSWAQNVSTELHYDYFYLIGGGDGGTDRDPIGNSRARLDMIISDGYDGDAEMLLIQTGSQTTNQTLSYVANGQSVDGLGAGQPATNTVSLSGIPGRHRGVYFVLRSDDEFSSEDGLWPEGHGAILDDLAASDTGTLYAEQASASGTDPYGGTILVTVSSQYAISARVPPGVGTVWTIRAGNDLPTSDYCAPQKQVATDKMFLGADESSKLTLSDEYASVVTCTLPIPSGTASVFAAWGLYLDLPRQAGFVQYAEYRIHKAGEWRNWRGTSPSRSAKVWAPQAWTVDGEELPEAAGADSVQLRYVIKCVKALAADHANCQPVQYGVLYDDFRLQVTTGTPAPRFLIFVGGLAQSTFVDGTDGLSTGCSSGQISAGRCWPGVRGSNQPAASGPIHDNFNCPLGDSGTISMPTALRRRGMGMNWRYGFDKSILAGKRISRQNGAYNATYGTPHWIFRLYDPATTTWSPWDSSALDADAVALSGPDTILIDSAFRLDWPPRDKYYVNQGGSDVGPNADADLPGAGGGWSLNGNTKYSQVPFLPKGTRIQYYFKAVDINGGVGYQFSSDNLALESEDLPTLPGSSIKAPDIIEFDVLPRVYPPGAVGSLLAGLTDTKVLNLDGTYTQWSNGFDPVTQALRAMGVRADRYRSLQGLGEANNIGGHEFPGQRIDRLANYFPNDQEYGIKDSLAAHYTIIIQSSHLRTWTVFEEQDAHLVSQWWLTDTGVEGGDRCILGTGDAMFNALLNASKSFPDYAEQVSLAQNVFGVASCIDAWTGAATTKYPTIDDLFAGGGPGLAAPGTFTYPVDGGCPSPNRFDGLTKVGPSTSQVSAKFPGAVSEVAGIATSVENDPGGSTDNDRNKALAYGFSIQFIRSAGIPTTAPNYVHSGVQNRMRVLYKFLTSCRKTTGSTTPCWPCPSSPVDMTSNWATAAGFQTGTYGTLYAIQDYTTATGVLEEGPAAPRFVNALGQNRPNPFNPETVIPYSLATDGRVTIRIFDVAGRLVRTLVDGKQTAGPHAARWNGRAERAGPLASGIYFYTIQYPDGNISARKMTILR
jgi:FlgD Ig-like domain